MFCPLYTPWSWRVIPSLLRYLTEIPCKTNKFVHGQPYWRHAGKITIMPWGKHGGQLLFQSEACCTHGIAGTCQVDNEIPRGKNASMSPKKVFLSLACSSSSVSLHQVLVHYCCSRCLPQCMTGIFWQYGCPWILPTHLQLIFFPVWRLFLALGFTLKWLTSKKIVAKLV